MIPVCFDTDLDLCLNVFDDWNFFSEREVCSTTELFPASLYGRYMRSILVLFKLWLGHVQGGSGSRKFVDGLLALTPRWNTQV